jgi:hypothetical protein
MHLGILDRWMGTPRKADAVQRWRPDAELAYAADCYRYLLVSAPPLAIERAHAEVLQQLSVTQRHQLLRQLRSQLSESQLRETEPDSAPRTLARLLTCAELRHPGTLERALNAECPSMSGQSSMFWTVARAFAATPIAQQFLGGIDYAGVVTEPFEQADQAYEFDYEELGYEAPRVEYFLGRSGVER